MADNFSNRLMDGLEAKRQSFASEDFASDFGSAIVSRVRRRRAVSATAVGGGSVVAAGAVAFSAWQLPWVGSALVGPGGSPSVVCTTTTPDAVAGSAVEVPDGATWALIDAATGSVYFVGLVGGEARAWNADGSDALLVKVSDTVSTLKLSADVTVEVEPPGFSWTELPAGITAMGAHEYVAALTDALASTVSVIAEDGTVLGRAVHTSDGTLALVVDDSVYPLVEPDGLTYSYVDDAGQRVKVTLVDTDPAVGVSAATPSPTVTCVTTTPEPSDTASPSASPVISAQPSATPDPAVSDSFGVVASPFHCGFEFASAEPDPVVEFRNVHWLTADQAETSVRAFFMEPDSIDLNISGDDVPLVMYDFGAGPEIDSAGGTTGPYDPQGMLGAFGTTDGVEDTVQYAAGAAYVLAKDGVVVATYVSDQRPTSLYIDSYDADTGTLYGLNVSDALTTCSGEDVASLGDTDLYAVAGWIVEDPSGVHGPIYGWQKIDPES